MTDEERWGDAFENGLYVLDDSSLDGFENRHEMRALIASADISTAEKLAAFKRWENEDGSKAGLLNLQSTP